MSEIRVNNLSNEDSTSGPTISGITTFSGTNFFVPPVGNTAQRPDNPQKGALRFNTDSKHLEYYRGDTIGWSDIEAESTEPLGGGTGSNAGRGHRGVWGGSALAPSTGTYTNALQYITISTLGNAEDFGDMPSNVSGAATFSDRTRGVIGSGYNAGTPMMGYITFASKGDSIAFGNDLIQQSGAWGLSNSTRGLKMGGGPYLNNIAYNTIQTLGNAVDFGDLSVARSYAGGGASSTRGITAGGASPNGDTNVNVMDYVTIATTGNATDFGDMLDINGTLSPCGGSNSTRLITWGGSNAPGYANVNTMNYLTIATTGNMLDFGDLKQKTSSGAPCPDATRLVQCCASGDSASSNTSNIIDYVQFSTTGNSLDFGDATWQAYSFHQGTMTTGHGGL